MNNNNDNGNKFNKKTKPPASLNINKNNTNIFLTDSYSKKPKSTKFESYPKRPKSIPKTPPNSLNQIMDDLSSLKDMAKLHQETIDQLKQDNSQMLLMIETYMSQLSTLYPDADSFIQKDDFKTENDHSKSEYSNNSDKGSSFEDDDIYSVDDEEED